MGPKEVIGARSCDGVPTDFAPNSVGRSSLTGVGFPGRRRAVLPSNGARGRPKINALAGDLVSVSGPAGCRQLVSCTQHHNGQGIKARIRMAALRPSG